MVTVPFPDFAPDRNRYNTTAIPVALNVVPLVDGWGPLQSIVHPLPVFEYITDNQGNRLTDNHGNRLITGPHGASLIGDYALPENCTGMFTARKANGTEAIFAGTATHLYRFNPGSFVWQDVSGRTAPYSSACRWSFVAFGSVVYAQNGADPEQMLNLETDNEFSDNPSAPICKYLAVVGSLVFRGNIVSWADQGITNAPNMIQCSALENPQDNIPQNFNYSDFQSIPTGDEVMGIVPVSGGAHVWMKNALHGMTLTLQGAYTFTLTPINGIRGTSAPYSIGQIGQDDYLIYCDDGFWRYQGGFNAVGAGVVNNWFMSESDQADRENILAMPDPEHNIVWVAYTASDASRRMLGMHYVFNNRWCYSNVSLLASTRARTFAYSTSIPPIVTNDLLRFAIVDEGGRLGYLVGNTLSASLLTNEVQFGPKRSFIDALNLNGDPIDYTVTAITRDKKGGPSRARTPTHPSSRSGTVYVRADGETHQFQLDIPADSNWTNVTSLEIPAKAAAQS